MRDGAPDVLTDVREAMYQAGIRASDGRTAREMTDAEVHQALDATMAHMQAMTAMFQQVATAFTRAAERLGAVLRDHPAVMQVAVELDRRRDGVLSPIEGT